MEGEGFFNSLMLRPYKSYIGGFNHERSTPPRPDTFAVRYEISTVPTSINPPLS
jgi:hypothetical protein